jgi:hypothetical protein
MSSKFQFFSLTLKVVSPILLFKDIGYSTAATPFSQKRKGIKPAGVLSLVLLFTEIGLQLPEVPVSEAGERVMHVVISVRCGSIEISDYVAT